MYLLVPNFSFSESDNLLFIIICCVIFCPLFFGLIQVVTVILKTITCVLKNKPLGKLNEYWLVVVTHVLVSFLLLFLMKTCSGGVFLFLGVFSVLWIQLVWVIIFWYSNRIASGSET